MSQFELDEQEAMDYIMDNFWEEDNQMIVDISGLAFGTLGHS